MNIKVWFFCKDWESIKETIIHSGMTVTMYAVPRSGELVDIDSGHYHGNYVVTGVTHSISDGEINIPYVELARVE